MGLLVQAFTSHDASRYYTVYKEMGREQENINESFGELGKMGKGRPCKRQLKISDILLLEK